MALNKKLGRPTDQRLAVLRNQASYLLWNGKLETTVEKAKSLRSYAEKLITLAINTYEDVIETEKEVVDAKGKKSTVKVTIDGPKKLNARRKLMSKVYDIQEQKHYDLILSDIEMPKMNGMELAGYIKSYLPQVFIIFITSHIKYAIDAYELSIFRYVPKNMITERLKPALKW